MRKPLDLEAPAAPERRHPLTIGSLALVLFAVLAAAATPWVVFGLMVFAVSAVAWLAALSKVPLSLAYPFNAVSFLVILTASILVLHERANLLTWVGTALVV